MKAKLPLIAFVGLALATSVGLSVNASQSTAKLQKAQTVACEKANELRHESNSRIKSHLALKETLSDFLQDSQDARRASFRRTGNASDKLAVKRYVSLDKRLESKIKYHITPLINCSEEPDETK